MDIGIIFLLILGLFLAQILIFIFVFRYIKKKGILLRDEMTREMMRKSSEISFWGSWVFWIIILILESISEFTFNFKKQRSGLMAKKTKEEEFTTRIKELRARYNLTQSDLAKMVNVRRETILYIEKGKYNPSLVLAHKISKALNSKIDEVFLFADDQD